MIRVIFVCLAIFASWTAFSQTSTIEICRFDNYDDDGDGLDDCNANPNLQDPDCVPAAGVEEKCACNDGQDNDGDGVQDEFDGDCANYYGLEFIGESGGCEIPPKDPNTAFNIAPPVKTAQNSTDTQSKLAIGDIDCDGVPDVVFVSKWAQAVKIMATTDDQAFDGVDEGDIKAEFNTPGKKIFPSGPGFDSQWYFEMEIAIGNIDVANGGVTAPCDPNNPETGNPVEIFAFASNRKNANDEPSNFVLTGLSYTTENGGGELAPIDTWKCDFPVISQDRPGEIALADFDGDGLAEIFFKNEIWSSRYGCKLAEGVGNLDWNTELSSAPVAVDLIPGGNLELVVGNLVYQVPDLPSDCSCDGSGALQMTPIWDMNDLAGDNWFPKEIFDEKEYGFDNFSSTSVADLDNDGDLEIVLSGALNSKNGATSIFVWDFDPATGGEVYHYEPHDPDDPLGWKWGTSRPNLGNIDTDAYLEITFIAGNQLFAIEWDSGVGITPVWGYDGDGDFITRLLNDSRSGIVATTVYDFDNDGQPEIVYRDSHQLVIINGSDPTDVKWSTTCESHTMTEGPIIADVNGDGQTDLCVPCNTNNSFDIEADLQQQALGQMRCYFSEEEAWLPTRQVWNQTGYYVTNINDDLTLPHPQMGMTTEFNEGTCNGVAVPQPFNTFLNQVPFLGADGCPTFPAPDLSFYGQNPTQYDPNDPTEPAIIVIPPICGDTRVDVIFNIINDGTIPISDAVDVSFWNGDPTLDVNAAKLATHTITVSGLGPGQTTRDSTFFNGPGTPFRLYILLNDDGTTNPIIDLALNNTNECRLTNNLMPVDVIPEPFLLYFDKKDNILCDLSSTDNSWASVGVLRATSDPNVYDTVALAGYEFFWYEGTDVNGTPIPAAQGGNSDMISNVADGDYFVRVLNTISQCWSDSVVNIADVFSLPADVRPSIGNVVHSSNCAPPNGEMTAEIIGDVETGWTFTWFNTLDLSTPIGTGKTITGVEPGSYIVRGTKNSCNRTSTAVEVRGPQALDVEPFVKNHIIDCADLESGIVSATAQYYDTLNNNQLTYDLDSTKYEFTWVFWDTVNNQAGSILPPEHGAAGVPTRSGLTAGVYGVSLREISSDCYRDFVTIEIFDNTITPFVEIFPLTDQSSCDPANPNGSMKALVTDGAGNPVADQTPYLFEWFLGNSTTTAFGGTTGDSDGATGNVALGLVGGGQYYTVRATTIANNCFATAADTIQDISVLPVITLVKDSDNLVCDPALAASGQFTGQITATVTENGNPITLPDPNYEFTVYAGSTITDPIYDVTTNPVFSGLEDGTYTVTVTRLDLSCESTPASEVVLPLQAPPPVETDIIHATNCIPGTNDNGSATAWALELGVRTTTNYDFTWYVGTDTTGALHPSTSGTNGQTADVLQGNTSYTVKVVNTERGCTNTMTIFVADNSTIPVILMSAEPNSICDNPSINYNGQVSFSVNDSSNVNGLPLTDFTGYTLDWTITDGIFAGQDIATTSIDMSTFGELNNVPAGTYQLVVTNDALSCVSDPVSIVVADSTVLPVLVTAVQESTNCIDDPQFANGSISVTADGLIDPNLYDFKWYLGDVVNPGSELVTTNPHEVTGVTGGDFYTVLVTNKNSGCSISATDFIPDISKKPILTIASTGNSVCGGGLDAYTGTVTITVTDDNNGGAQSPLDPNTYTVQWMDANDQDVFTTVSPVPTLSGDGLSVSGLPNGDYKVIVTNDVLGCFQEITSTVPYEPTFPNISITPIPSTNCVEDPTVQPNGSLEAVVTEAVPPADGYSYAWYLGNVISGSPLGTAAIQPNLQGGETYIVEVTNNNSGCTNTAIYDLPDNSQKPELNLTAAPNSVCTGGTDPFNGAITASVTDAGVVIIDFTDYEFTWVQQSNGNTTVTSGIGSNVLTGLPDGQYEVTVKNTALGCSSNPIPITINFTPTYPVVDIVPTPSTNCEPQFANGSMNAFIVSGVTTAETDYVWTWTDVNGNPVTANAGDPSLIEDLQGGNGIEFTVTVLHVATGCTDTKSMLLQDISEKPTLTATPYVNTICDPANNGGVYNGRIEVDGITDRGVGVAADDSNYEYRWYTGTTATNIINGETTYQLNDVGPGNYTVVVRNNLLGCESDPIYFEVKDQITLPTADISREPQTSCDITNPLGEVHVTITDAVPASGYTYTWFESDDNLSYSALNQTAAVVNNGDATALLGQKYYQVLIENDDTGCTNTVGIYVPEVITLPDPILNVESGMTNCATPDGEISATVSGEADLTNFEFFWYKGYTTNPADVLAEVPVPGDASGIVYHSNLLPDDYTLVVHNTITDCYSIPESIEVPNLIQDIEIDITITGPTPSDCQDNSGELTATPVLPAGSVVDDFYYAWYDTIPSNTSEVDFVNIFPIFPNAPIYEGMGAPNNVAGSLTSGYYTVVVTYSNAGGNGDQCQAMNSIFLPFADAPTVNPTVTNSLICDETNSIGNGGMSFTMTTVGGFVEADYDYAFVRNSDGTTITGPIVADTRVPEVDLLPGDYTIVLIERSSGCPIYEFITINNDALPPRLDLVGTISASSYCGAGVGDGMATMSGTLDPDDVATDFIEFDISPDPTEATSNDWPQSFDIASAASVDFINLPEGTYTISATGKVGNGPGEIRGCTVTRDITVQNIPHQPEILGNYITRDPEYCVASGLIEIQGIQLRDGNNNVTPENIDDYEFRWYQDAIVPGAEIFVANGNSDPLIAGGEVLDSINFAGMGAGTYVVIAEKNVAGDGFGCTTQSLTFVLNDNTVDLNMSLKKNVNTSCDTSVGEGSIEISVTTSGGPGADPVTYTYDVTGPTGALPQQSGDGDGDDTDGDGDIFYGLIDGNYIVRATNDITSCFVEQEFEILQNSQPIFILTTDKQDPQYCIPSGYMEVLEVGLNSGGPAQPLADFEFEWFRTTKDDPDSLLRDSNGDPILTPRVDPGTAAGQFPDLLPGTYHVRAISIGAIGFGCKSPYETFILNDASNPPSILYSTEPDFACDPDNSTGEITVTVDGGGSPDNYTYEWIEAYDEDGNDILGQPGIPDDRIDGTATSDEVWTGIRKGEFTLRFTNLTTGCDDQRIITVYDEKILPKIQQIIPEPNTLCIGQNGSITVSDTDVSITDENGFTTNIPVVDLELTLYNNPDLVTPFRDDASTIPGVGTKTFDALGEGTYYLTVRRTGGAPLAGEGCESSPQTIVVVTNTITPTTSWDADANTSCDDGFGNGSLTINYRVDPASLGADDLFTIKLYSIPTNSLVNGEDITFVGDTIFITDIPVAGGDGTYTSLGTDNVLDGSYEYLVVNQTTGCQNNSIVEVPFQEIVPDVVTPAATTMTSCTTPDGVITVNRTDIEIDGVQLDDFARVTLDLQDANGTSYPETTADPNFFEWTGMSFGTYTLYVTINAIPLNQGIAGVGCSPSQISFEVIDQRRYPNITYTKTPNTVCDPNFAVQFDGTINISVADPPGAPGEGATYTYLVTRLEDGVIHVNNVPGNNGNGDSSDGDSDQLTGLQEGTYEIIATNDVTGCSSNQQVSLAHQPFAIPAPVVDVQDQPTCFPGGSITVVSIENDDIANFNFYWFRGDNQLDTIRDGLGDPIIDPFLDVNNYPAIDSGTYTMVAQKVIGSGPGMGCPAQTVKRTIKSTSVQPQVTIVESEPNSACDEALANGVLLATASEFNGPFPPADNYDFIWEYYDEVTGSYTILPGPATPNQISPYESELVGAVDGTYRVSVTNINGTNCLGIGSITVQKDSIQGTTTAMNIIPTHPVNCFPTGEAEISEITIGNDPPITDPAFIAANFTFRWYRDSVDASTQLNDFDRIANNLLPGFYYVIAESGLTGCEGLEQQVEITEQNIQPMVVSIFENVPSIKCVGTPGSAELEASVSNLVDPNDAPDLIYRWYHALDTAGQSVQFTGSIYSNLDPGDYIVEVYNPNTNCYAYLNKIIEDQSGLFGPIIVARSVDLTNCDTFNGSVEVLTLDHENPPYPPTLAPPSYSFEWYVGDSASVIPGVDPIAFNGQVWQDIDSGYYTVLVRDDYTGCTAIAETYVEDLRTPPVLNVKVDNPLTNCDPLRPNGQLSVVIDEGSQFGSYDIAWYEGTNPQPGDPILSSTRRLIGVVPGTYSVVVTDLLTQCIAIDSGTVENEAVFPHMVFAQALNHQTNCDTEVNKTGVLTAWVVNNAGDSITNGYEFYWFEGTSITTDTLNASPWEPKVQNLGMGDYLVQAYSIETGCISDPVPVSIYDSINYPRLVFSTGPSFCLEPTGFVEVEVYGIYDSPPVVAKSITWSFYDPYPTTVLENEYTPGWYRRPAGVYEAVIETMDNCIISDTVSIPTEIRPYNGISANDGDGQNDYFHIDCIEQFPDNNVKIFYRTGILVFEADGYLNEDPLKRFEGIGKNGVYFMGEQVPDGTYFYIVDKKNGSKPSTGFLEIVGNPDN